MRLMFTSSTLAALCCALVPRRGARAFQVGISRTAMNRGALGVPATKNAVPMSRWSSTKVTDDLLTRLFASVEEEINPGVVEGTDLRIVEYPHPSLRAENSEITADELKEGSIAKIAKEMFLIMYAAGGVGLAAPQVGINKRLMVYNESGDRKKWLDEVVMVNPKIVQFSEGTDVAKEGCLSFPNMDGEVKRSKWIKVEAQSLKGKKIKKKFTGWEARIFQHEYDHLNGVVYIDHLSEEGRKEVQPVLDELIAAHGEGGAL